MKVVKVKNILEALGSKEDGEVARFVNILIYPRHGKHSRTCLSILVVELASFSIVGCVVMTVLFLLNELKGESVKL